MKKILIIFLLFLFTMSLGCTSVQNIFNKNQGARVKAGGIKNNEPVRLILYYPDKTLDSLKPEERVAAFKRSLEETILSELLKGSKSRSPFAFPRGTKILSVTRKDETVSINFSGEFIKNFTENENIGLMTIFSIVNSITEIPGVKKVVLKVKGRTIESMAEKLKIDNPLLRNRNLILRNKELGPKEVLSRQLTLEREGKWLESYLLYSDDEDDLDRKYYHDYVVEMEEVRDLGFTNQDFEIGEGTLDNTGTKARVKVNFYIPTTYGTKEKSLDIYFNCVKINEVWMVDWLTAQ